MANKHNTTIPLSPKWLPLATQRLAEREMERCNIAAGMDLLRSTTPTAQTVHVLDTMRSIEQLMHGLLEADSTLWWVDADMTELAVDCANDPDGFDGRTGVRFPSENGLVAFAKNLPLDVDTNDFSDAAMRPVSVPIRAIAWHGDEEGATLALLTADPAYMTGKDDKKLPLRMASLERDAQTGDAGWAWRLLCAVWALSDQPRIAQTRRETWNEQRDGREPSSLRKARNLLHGDTSTRLIYVRENIENPHESGEPSATRREYDCRFIVRGHYRNQAYGERHSLRKRVWIAPFIKGAANKPLRLRDGAAVHVLKR